MYSLVSSPNSCDLSLYYSNSNSNNYSSLTYAFTVDEVNTVYCKSFEVEKFRSCKTKL